MLPVNSQENHSLPVARTIGGEGVDDVRGDFLTGRPNTRMDCLDSTGKTVGFARQTMSRVQQAPRDGRCWKGVVTNGNGEDTFVCFQRRQFASEERRGHCNPRIWHRGFRTRALKLSHSALKRLLPFEAHRRKG